MLLSVLLAACVGAPNIVLISVDTLRADHLGCYGHPFNTSPNIDALAKQSLVYEDAVCEVPLTGPSFCAMMSSRYPRLTGATRNALPLPDDVPTVAQGFQDAGYSTLCVQSNWTLKRDLSNLQRGFDIYEDDFHKKRWGFIKSERDADEVTNLAIELLQHWDQTKPLFAWFHFSDPHAPYKRHRKFDVRKGDTRHDASRRDAEVKRNYDSEVAYTDHHIGLLLEALPKTNTFVVFLADHGESLYEHDYLGHGRRIYQSGLRIPFMISGPGIEPGRSASPIRGIDVGPTLLGLAGLAPLPGMLGANVLTSEIPRGRVRAIETYGGAVLNLPGVRDVMEDADPQLQGVLLNGWKLILEGDRAELYFLPDDPAELENRSGEHQAKVSELSALIHAWDAETERMTAQGATLSESDIEALESLGYVE